MSHEHASNESMFYPEGSHTWEAVFALKKAASYLEAPSIHWQSRDELSDYIAQPMGEANERVDITRIGQLSLMDFDESFNMWEILKLSAPTSDDEEFKLDRFIIGAGGRLHITHGTLAKEAFYDEDTFSEALAKVQADSAFQIELGLTEADELDYAHLADAIFDLQPVNKRAMDDWLERRRNMTREDKLRERMQKYALEFPDEPEKLSARRWWYIDEAGAILHAVRAFSPDEAAALLDEHLEENRGTNLLPFFFFTACGDDEGKILDAKFEGRDVVNLIPWSTEEWPADISHATPEQRAALDRLKRDSP